MNRSITYQFQTDQEKDISVLPIKTQSLCPECLAVIDAQINDVDGMVYMDKYCPVHGFCQELISRDTEFYKLILERDLSFGRGVTNPLKGKQAACPNGCGVCSEHLSPPMMVNIDLTNRCNLNCPVCFANASATGKVIELDIEQVRTMLDAACSTDKVKPVCFQYTGGEPTIHPDFLEALRAAKEHNFTQIQVATNGITFARDVGFAAQASEAGLNVAYLQFDGLDDQVYLQTRGRALLDVKIKAIKNLYSAGIRTVLVPTIVRGVNDNQIGAITRFAIENINEIIGISWQPVAFTGRIDYKQRLARRFTLSDLAFEVQRQTGLVDMYRDWYPFCFAGPFAQLLEEITGEPQLTLSCNPTCGVVTYLVVSNDRKEILPIPAFVDVDLLMVKIAEIIENLKNHRYFHKLSLLQKLRGLKKYYHADLGPSQWTFDNFVDFIMDFIDFRKRYGNNKSRIDATAQRQYKILLMASMHFQDVYNYQIDRVKRCVVHYAAPDGRMYPFCSYNSGPCHRNRIERQFMKPAVQNLADA